MRNRKTAHIRAGLLAVAVCIGACSDESANETRSPALASSPREAFEIRNAPSVFSAQRSGIRRATGETDPTGAATVFEQNYCLDRPLDARSIGGLFDPSWRPIAALLVSSAKANPQGAMERSGYEVLFHRFDSTVPGCGEDEFHLQLAVTKNRSAGGARR